MSPACGPIVSRQPNTTSSTACGSTPGALHEGTDGVAAEVGRVDLGETATTTAHGRANGFDDEGF